MAGQIVPSTPEEAEAAGVAAWITPPPHGDVTERLRVHGGGYPARLEEALAENFPALAHPVGAGAFRELAGRFAARIPLASYNLNDAGAPLPEFLRGDPLAERLLFLPDLARLEWDVARAFHAADERTFDPAALAGWGLEEWTRAVVGFQPAVAIVTSAWPIREIWECRERAIEAIDIDLCNRPDRVLVRREGFAVVCESLDEAQANTLAALLAGRTLGDVVDALGEHADLAASVSAWFARWMSLRMITGCSLASG
jgi:hypothetical protein